MKALGINAQGDYLEYPLTHTERETFWSRGDIEVLRQNEYVCVHPGGRGATRRWKPAHFAHVADKLIAEGLQVVVTGVTGEEEIGVAMIRSMKGSAVTLIGRTDLAALGVLLEGAKLLVANDTGVSHVAAALRLPSVIVSTGSDPLRWGPLDRQRHRVLTEQHATVESVWSEIHALLGLNRRVVEV